MKTAILLSGRHEPTEERYKGVEQFFKDAGWEQVVRYDSDWGLSNVKRFADDFLQTLPDNCQPLTLFGFSLGAMIALIASTKVDVDNLILCSPSGYFKEYISLLSAEDMGWAKEHLKDFESWSAIEIIKSSKASNGYILAGENELKMWPDFKKWIEDLQSQTQWPLSVVSGIAHEIEASQYQQIIHLIIKDLD